MTCIVGIANGKSVWMGGDSSAVDAQSGEICAVADPKVFLLGSEMLVGYTGSFRVGQLLQYKLKLPKRKAKQTDIQYLTTDFMDSVRKILKAGDWNVLGPEGGPTFLIGYRGKLYEVGEEMYVLNYEAQETAVGAGGVYALGSLHTTRQIKELAEPEERIAWALSASSAHCAFVIPPFHILKLE